jgi:hypothetical protein
MASLGWVFRGPTKAWQVAATGLAVLPVTAGVRHVIEPGAQDAWGWGLLMAAVTTVASGLQLRRRDSDDHDETRENLPPYGGEWPPSQ